MPLTSEALIDAIHLHLDRSARSASADPVFTEQPTAREAVPVLRARQAETASVTIWVQKEHAGKTQCCMTPRNYFRIQSVTTKERGVIEGLVFPPYYDAHGS